MNDQAKNKGNEKSINHQDALPAFRAIVPLIKELSPPIREMVLERYAEMKGYQISWKRGGAKIFLEALIQIEDIVELDKKLKDKSQPLRDIRRPLETHLYP